MPKLRSRLFLDYYVGGLLHVLLKPLAILLGWILRRDHDLEKCSDITFVKLLGGGSLVVAYPALLALRLNPRIKKLRLLATPQTAPFGHALGIFDEILILRDRNLFLLILDSFLLILRLFRTEALVDLEIHSRLSTVFCVLTMARNRIGAYTEVSFWRRHLATHLLYYNKIAPIHGLYDQIAELFGSPPPPFSQCITAFRTSLAPYTHSPRPISAQDIAIAPCCSDLSRERLLTDAQWLAILHRELPAIFKTAANGPVCIYLLGGPKDGPRLERLAALLQTNFPGFLFVTHPGDLSLPSVASLLAQVSCLVAIDSALLHMARLVGTPTSSYWGPTDPATLLKAVTPLDVIHYRRIACSPCVHIANIAPCRGNNICMNFAVEPNCALDPNPIWLAENPHTKRGEKP